MFTLHNKLSSNRWSKSPGLKLPNAPQCAPLCLPALSACCSVMGRWCTVGFSAICSDLKSIWKEKWGYIRKIKIEGCKSKQLSKGDEKLCKAEGNCGVDLWCSVTLPIWATYFKLHVVSWAVIHKKICLRSLKLKFSSYKCKYVCRRATERFQMLKM